MLEEDWDSNHKTDVSVSVEKAKDDQQQQQQQPQPDWNQIRGKLYDRSGQEQELMDAFLRTCNSNSNTSITDSTTTRELILITGPSGTGKVRLPYNVDASSPDFLGLTLFVRLLLQIHYGNEPLKNKEDTLSRESLI